MGRVIMRKAKPSDALWRGLYGIEREGVSWVVEVDYFDFAEKVRIFRDSVLAFEGRSPARFEVAPGVEIQATMALYGMKRIHLVDSATGRAEMLQPLPGTAEFARGRFGREHPVASAAIAVVAWCTLLVALVTQVPNAINSLVGLIDLLHIPVSVAKVPVFDLPGWVNTLLGVLGICAGLDRGLRMKHNALLDD